MSIDRTRYRQIQFVGARILEAREMNDLQDITQGFAFDDVTPASYALSGIFRQGATYNVNVGISNKTVTLSAIDGTKPMLVFVRDRWEAIKTAEIASPLTLSPSGPLQTDIWLNWELHVRTSSDDPDLIDSITSDPTANMGEMILVVGLTDTSGVSLTGSQMAKNTSAISLFNFTHTPTSLSQNFVDNVIPQALANSQVSGLVKATTNTPIVVSTDDPRMSNTRGASDGSVHDATVRTPSAAGGTNADGSPTYNLTGDIGGINAAKLIWLGGTQLVSDALSYIKSLATSITARYNAHEGAALGFPTTHPLPTAAQVGAAPLSHVGLPLGLATSHPPVVNVDSGGFQVNRSTGNGGDADPAYAVFVGGNPIVAMTHLGEVFSNPAGLFTASPLIESGDVGLGSGPLTFMSKIAQVLSQHVNKTSHKNPHGLAPGDIGAATTGYVDSSIANVLAAAENFTNSVSPFLSLSLTNVTGTGILGGTYLILRHAPNNGNGIEIALGFGTALSTASGINGTASNFTIPLPAPTGWTPAPSGPNGALYSVSVHSLPFVNGNITGVVVNNPSAGTYNGHTTRFSGAGSQVADSNVQFSWISFAWRQGV